MALITCKECGNEISTTARACPKCGAKQVRTSGCAKFGLYLMIFTIVIMVIGKCSESSERRAQESMQQGQQEEYASISKAKLEKELKTNRQAIVNEINGLMKKKEYSQAYQRANSFRDFNDKELNNLAASAQSRIEEAQKAKQKTEDLRVASSIKKMKKSTDKIEGVDWYQDRSSPAYSNQNGFYLYFGKKDNNSPSLRLRIQYAAEDWLFINSFIVVADGQRFERSNVDFERDNDSKIWEWYDENLTDNDMQMIKAIIASKETVIRFEGRQYRKDITITAAQKTALQNVLDAYNALGGA